MNKRNDNDNLATTKGKDDFYLKVKVPSCSFPTFSSTATNFISSSERFMSIFNSNKDDIMDQDYYEGKGKTAEDIAVVSGSSSSVMLRNGESTVDPSLFPAQRYSLEEKEILMALEIDFENDYSDYSQIFGGGEQSASDEYEGELPMDDEETVGSNEENERDDARNQEFCCRKCRRVVMISKETQTSVDDITGGNVETAAVPKENEDKMEDTTTFSENMIEENVANHSGGQEGSNDSSNEDQAQDRFEFFQALVPQVVLNQPPQATCSNAVASTSTQELAEETHGVDKNNLQNGWVCLCKMTFASKTGLLMHIRYYTKDPKFKCTHCPSSFPYLSYLKRHMMSWHNLKHPGGDGAIGCALCGAIFASREEYNEHRSSVHPQGTTDKNSIDCVYCGKLFTERELYLQHQQLEHGTVSGPAIQKSPAINKPGRVHGVIRNRKTNQNSPSSGPLIRCRCGETFPTMNELRSHTRKMRPKVPFTCPHCHVQYKVHSRLGDHIRKVHKIVDFNDVGCYACGTSWPTKTALRLHAKQEHGGRNAQISPEENRSVQNAHSSGIFQRPDCGKQAHVTAGHLGKAQVVITRESATVVQNDLRIENKTTPGKRASTSHGKAMKTREASRNTGSGPSCGLRSNNREALKMTTKKNAECHRTNKTVRKSKRARSIPVWFRNNSYII